MESRRSWLSAMERRVAAALTVTLIIAIASVQQCAAAAVASVSVCSDLCTCTNQNFATVDCVFDGRAAWPPGAAPSGSVTAAERHPAQFVLDGRLQLPPSATALNIKLIAGGHLAIRKDFFNKNMVNHLSIDGSESTAGAETTVEFHEGALCNIHGGFPEILVTNVDRLVMNKNISCGAHLLNVTHVRAVRLKTEFLSVVEAEILIENVHNLQIDSNAFRGSTMSKVQIHSTTIESLPKLGASFRLLSFNKCNISEIVPYAFDANEIEHVEFVNCRLKNLRQQAVTGRLVSNSLIFRGCNIQRIEKQFVDKCGLKELQLDGNSIDEIAPGAFNYTGVHTSITGNHIIKTGKDWLHPAGWTNVTVSGNSFGEFHGLSLGSDDKTTTATCSFVNNSVTNPQKDSFTFARKCNIDAVLFNRVCDCSFDSWMADLFGTSQPASTGAASCLVEASLRYCFNLSEAASNDTNTADQINVRFFLKEFCKKGGSIQCSSLSSGIGAGGKQKDRKSPPLIPPEKIDTIDEESESGFAGWSRTLVFGSIAALAVLAIILSLTTYCCWWRKHGETHIPMTEQSSRPGTVPTAGHHTRSASSSLTRGDKKVMENALRWLRDSYDPKVWSEINAPMQQLLTKSNGAIGEQEKVRLIGSILDSFKRHNINGDQIVALNAIFYRYLGPPASEQSPDGTRTDNERSEDPQGHIYAEVQPNNRRPPTAHGGMLGDYAAPLDHGAATTVPEGIYAEPILRNEHDQQLLQRGGNRHLISPYAIGDATIQRNSAGTESGNLPDVILLRPQMRPPDGGDEADPRDDDNEDDYDDEIDGEPERKTMLRPPDTTDGGAAGGGPTYAISMKKLNRTPNRDNTPLPPLPAPRAPTAAASSASDESDGTDGNGSEHSGSSMQTVRIEDLTLADEGTSEQQYQCNK